MCIPAACTTDGQSTRPEGVAEFKGLPVYRGQPLQNGRPHPLVVRGRVRLDEAGCRASSRLLQGELEADQHSPLPSVHRTCVHGLRRASRHRSPRSVQGKGGCLSPAGTLLFRTAFPLLGGLGRHVATWGRRSGPQCLRPTTIQSCSCSSARLNRATRLAFSPTVLRRKLMLRVCMTMHAQLDHLARPRAGSHLPLPRLRRISVLKFGNPVFIPAVGRP
jgi:hypothetical protein